MTQRNTPSTTARIDASASLPVVRIALATLALITVLVLITSLSAEYGFV